MISVYLRSFLFWRFVKQSDRRWLWRAIFPALAFLLLANPAYAQSGSHDTTVDYSPLFHRITTRDGLPHYTVLAITQDAQGFLWFATGDGLARYDGYDFFVYRTDPQRTD